jgi:chromosome segregation ATPase
MDESTPTPVLRRAWLAGYRVGDVEVLLAELRFKVTHLRDETSRLALRLSEVERHRSDLEQRLDTDPSRDLQDDAQPATVEPDLVEPAELEPARAQAEAIIEAAHLEAERIRATATATEGALTFVPSSEAILDAQYSPAMLQDSGLRRAFFRGYRRGDVEAALAHERLLRTGLELELAAATKHANAMKLELTELNARIDAGRAREASLAQSLDEVRQRRAQAERESQHRADEVLREAEELAAALKTEGMRQVGELQGQVESLLGLRTGLTRTMQQLSEDVAAAMARLAAGAATAIDYKPEDQLSRWAPHDS